jgi:hypothetical protein
MHPTPPNVPFDAPGSIMVKQRRKRLKSKKHKSSLARFQLMTCFDEGKKPGEKRASKIPRKRNGRLSTNPPSINHRSNATTVQREQAECKEHRSGPEKIKRERSNRGQKRTNSGPLLPTLISFIASDSISHCHISIPSIVSFIRDEFQHVLGTHCWPDASEPLMYRCRVGGKEVV